MACYYIHIKFVYRGRRELVPKNRDEFHPTTLHYAPCSMPHATPGTSFNKLKHTLRQTFITLLQGSRYRLYTYFPGSI